MRFIKTFNSFKDGRISRKLYGRIDSKQYLEGLSDLSNMYPMQGGGLNRFFGSRVDYRPDAGFDFVPLLSGNQKSFVFQEFDAPQVLTACVDIDNAVYLYKWAPDKDAYTVFQILPEGSLDISAKGFSFCSIDNTVVMTHDSGVMMPFFIENGTIDSANVKVLLPTDYGSVHPNVDEWNTANPGSPFVYASRGVESLPMTDLKDNSNTLAISAVTITAGRAVHDITSTDAPTAAILQRSPAIYVEQIGKAASNASFIASFYGFRGTNVTNGAKFSTNWKYRDFGTGTANQSMLSLGDVTSAARWSTPMWYTGNWPKYVATSESRLIFAGTNSDPKTIFGSGVGSYTKFWQFRYPETGLPGIVATVPSGSIIETDPYIFTASAVKDSKVTGIVGGEMLTVMTDTNGHVFSGGDSILSALSVQTRSVIGQGATSTLVEFFAGTCVFVSFDRKRLHGFTYVSVNGEKQDYELSVLFSDLLEGHTIVDIQADDPRNILWVLLSTGKLLALLNVSGTWAVIRVANNETITDITVIPRTDSSQNVSLEPADPLGNCLVAQTSYANGAEWSLSIAPQFSMDSDTSIYDIAEIQTGQFLSRRSRLVFNAADDSWTLGIGSTGYMSQFTDANVIPVIDELYEPTLHPFYGDLWFWKEGTDEVYRLTQAALVALPRHTTPGFPYYKYTWPGSAIEDGDVICMGYVDPAEWSTLPVEAGQQWGTAQMGIKNIDTLGIRHYKTLSYEVSSRGDQWQEKVVADGEGKATDGRAEIKFTASPDYDHIVRVRNIKPEPITILSLSLRGVSNDG